MWYFAWILGLGFICVLSILNAIWLELRYDEDERKGGWDL